MHGAIIESHAKGKVAKRNRITGLILRIPSSSPPHFRQPSRRCSQGGKDVEVSGSPTEKAIIQWGLNLGMNFEAVRSESSIIHAFMFNLEKKRGGVAVKLTNFEVHVNWKGAAEIVLAACTRYMDTNEQLVPLDEGKVEYFKKAIEDMARGSLRCIAIAYRPLQGEAVPTDEEELANWELPEGDLVLLAIVGLKKKKLSDMLGPHWSKEELEHFYEAYVNMGETGKRCLLYSETAMWKCWRLFIL